MTDLILFDLDGTLTDSALGITTCVQHALTRMGYPTYPREQLFCFVGPPLVDMFQEFAGMSLEDSKKAVALYRARYKDIGIFENEVYPGIPEVLQYLKDHGKILGVASSKPEVFVERILDRFDLAQYFTYVTGSEMSGKRVNKPEVLKVALARAGYADRKDACILVGDRKYDIEGAHEVGLRCVGVSYGYGGREEMEAYGADLICDTVEDLKCLVKV